MQVALKVWRYDSSTGERALREYEVDVPEEATLLDTLDAVKDRVDGTLAYRKSCRMMICGSCGMRMDGAAVLACKTPMHDIAAAGHVPVVSAMGNLPIVKDLVVDMAPFWDKFKAMKPWLQPGYEEPPAGKEYVVSQERMNVIHKESLCINCGCCVSECNAMESDPDFRGPQALAKGMRFVGDPRDAATVERLEDYSDEHGIWECTRCYFCQERCPKGVDPRDAIAKLGAEAMRLGIDRDMGAKHADWFVKSAKSTGWLRETELVPKTQGLVSAIKQTKFALNLARHGKVPLPFPPHVAAQVKESRALFKLVKTQGRDGALGIVQGERALSRLEHGHGGDRDPYDRPDAFPRPFVAGEEPNPNIPPTGSVPGQSSRTQADVTPGEGPTRKYAAEQPGQEGMLNRREGESKT
jgi:succinate dehydrogenase / fumarate reductase iron-sulfur subunit